MSEFEAGQVYEVRYPFVRSEYEDFDADGPHMRKTWKPGVDHRPCGPEDFEAYADAAADRIGGMGIPDRERGDIRLLVRSRSGKAMTTEDTPHATYPKDRSEPPVICPTYKAAHDIWREVHRWQAPWVIETIATGRVIEPDEAITGPGE